MRDSDGPAVHAWARDPRVCRYQAWGPDSEAEAHVSNADRAGARSEHVLDGSGDGGRAAAAEQDRVGLAARHVPDVESRPVRGVLVDGRLRVEPGRVVGESS